MKSFKEFILNETTINIDDIFIHKKSNKKFVVSSTDGNQYHLYPVDSQDPNDKNAMTLNKNQILQYFTPINKK